ncbi:MAG: molybdenum cofactor guanylyltransferase [Chloroflexi bacterium]|nr:molybdenum cofactor guanylyltransferase [Chloroflexota bacterium]
MKASHSNWLSCEICILAGGLSSRMGRDKARLRLGNRTLLGHIRATARQLLLPVRVIRRDRVSRCGPLGGIYTALSSTRAETVLFLSCDMPFVSPSLLRQPLNKLSQAKAGVFVREGNKAGFPFVLRRTTLSVVKDHIERQEYPLQALAKKLKARTFRPRLAQKHGLLNVNTPAQWKTARELWRALRASKPGRTG